MHFSLNSAAVPWGMVTAHLHKEQISTGVVAATKACLVCRAALSSGECIWPGTVVQCLGEWSLHTCMKSKYPQVCLQRHKPAVGLSASLLSAALRDRLATGLYPCNYTREEEHCSGQNAVVTAQCCSARQACSRLVFLQPHL